MFESSKKHVIGYSLLIILIAFYYLFGFIALNIIGFTSIILECVFLVVYIGMLIFLTWYFKKNDLFSECVILNIFCFTLANPYFLSIVYYPFFAMFQATSYLDGIDKILDKLFYPLNIFYTDISWVIIIISPIIPLISLIKIRKQRKQQNNIEINDDNSLNNPEATSSVEE